MISLKASCLMSFARLVFQLSPSPTQPHLFILPNRPLQDMSALSKFNPDHGDLEQPDRTLVSNPSSSPPRSASVLNNAKMNHIHDNVITTNNNTTNISSSASSLDLLYRSVAPNAILNSGGRADEVRCHPGTREKVIGLVEKSIAQQYTEPQMLWLSGPAGAGKSAIMQTVAERCKDQDVPHANFFFFRADSSRKDAGPFVATLMHQIIKRYPSVGATVETTLTSDPLLFRMGVQQQFHDLLHHALATLHDTLPSLPPIALLIDGLDECDSENKTEQRQILQALDSLLIQKGRHVRVVIASRVESQISMAVAQLQSHVNSIFLDEKYAPEEDILRFVTAEFDKIKKTHSLSHKLGPEWPSESDISGIVSKSSGQFIFASTVMRFMMHSPASPILSLQKVQGLVPPNKNSPFAHIDTVYAYILGQVEDPEAVKVLLSIGLLRVYTNNVALMEAYRSSFTEAVVDSCSSELTPLVRVTANRLEFFHASFPDFLQDETRAKEYYINIDTFRTGAFVIWWQNRSSASIWVAIIHALKRVQQPTHEMTTALMERKPINSDSSDFLNDIVEQLHRIYAPWPKDLEIFNQIMHMWALHNTHRVWHIPQKYFQPVSQKHSSNFRMDQLNLQTHLSTLQTRPSTSDTYGSTPNTRPPTPQARPAPSQVRGFERQALPPTLGRTEPLTLETRPSTPKSRPSTPRARPVSPQTPRCCSVQ